MIKKYMDNYHINNNIGWYKGYRTSLMEFKYPEASVGVGKAKFSKGIFKGLTARLWHDEIFILFDDEFKKNNPNIIDNIQSVYIKFNEIFDYSVKNKTISIKPIQKNNFTNDKIGMRQRAVYYVFILDICLNSLIKD